MDKHIAIDKKISNLEYSISTRYLLPYLFHQIAENENGKNGKSRL